jgi:hypothetical protein
LTPSTPIMHRTTGNLWAILLLTTTLLLAFGHLVARPSALLADADHINIDHALPPDARAPGNDLIRLFLPQYLRIADQVARHGHPAAWDPAGFGGRPRVGNPQGGLWYPPVWIAWWSGRPAALGWLTVAHLLWGGIGAFALSLRSGNGKTASVLAGGCFQLAPYVLAQTFEGHYPHVWAASWYPWAFLAALGLRRGSPRPTLMLPPILALASLTGHPQEAYFLLLALGAWVAADLIAVVRAGRGRDAWAMLGSWLVVGLLGLGLVAVELIPDALAHRWTLQGPRPSIREAGRYHVSLLNLVQLLSPRALGGPSDYFGHENYWETVLAIGWAPLVLIAAALTQVRKSHAVRGWAALTAAAVVVAAGWRLGLFALLFVTVPGMAFFRVPARSLFLACLGASMLAGSGVEAMARGAGDWAAWARRFRGRALAIGAALAILAIVATWAREREPWFSIHPSAIPNRPVSDFPRLGRASVRLLGDPIFGASMIVTVAGLTWLARRPGDRQRVALLLATLALAERTVGGFELLKTSPTSRFVGHDEIGQALKKILLPKPFRIRARDAFYSDLRAARLGLEKTNVNDSFQIQHAADLYEALYGLFGTGRTVDRNGPVARSSVRLAVLERMNVGLVVSDRPVAALNWPLAASGTWEKNSFVIQRNPEPLPRAFVVPRAFIVPKRKPILWIFANLPARDGVVMTADPLGIPGHRQPFTRADYEADDPDRVVVRVATESPGLLVVADTWMPGWSAIVDGQPAPILRGNHAQRVIPLSRPGRHTIIMSYQPPGLTLGLWLTVATGLVWMALMAAVTHANRRTRNVGQRVWQH